MGQHSAANLLSAFDRSLENWNIPRSKCHIVLRDNAANISKCFRDGNIDSAGCFAHTVQLCVNDGILSQRYVSDLVKVGHRIIGHFKHSSSAMDRLHSLQAELNLPKHQLIQDFPTRLNSTFFMLQRLLEQRRAITLYCAENESVTNLSANQWSVAENVAAVLEPFEEVTREVSSSSASISIVIPMVRVLVSVLEKEGQDAGVKTMKATLLNAVNTRFQGIENNRVLSVATLLDPRFKTRFMNDTACTEAKAGVVLAATKLSRQLNQDSESASEEVVQGPQPAKVRRGDESASKLWDCFDEMLETETVAVSTSRSVSIQDSINDELSTFLGEPLLQRQQDPATWWKVNASRFPVMSKVAQIYLAPPPTSVPSERLFSVAGDIITEHRSRLLPDNAEKLIFLKYNASLI